MLRPPLSVATSALHEDELFLVSWPDILPHIFDFVICRMAYCVHLSIAYAMYYWQKS